MSTETTIRSRAEILKEIAHHEDCIQDLRQQLPTCIKSFFVFRVHPGKTSWAYGLSRDEAEKKVTERMNRDYPIDGWHFTSRAVSQFNDPQAACGESSGNLLRCLTESDALDFLKDWRANKSGRPETETPKNGYKSRLELDIEEYEMMQRRKAQDR
ncbi:MAG: hypothetical protein WDZ51_03460 [Pirellulaceae bacterium]